MQSFLFVFLSFFIDLPLPIRFLIIFLIGSVFGAIANVLVDRFSWTRKYRSPWNQRKNISLEQKSGQKTNNTSDIPRCFWDYIPIIGWFFWQRASLSVFDDSVQKNIVQKTDQKISVPSSSDKNVKKNSADKKGSVFRNSSQNKTAQKDLPVQANSAINKKSSLQAKTFSAQTSNLTVSSSDSVSGSIPCSISGSNSDSIPGRESRYFWIRPMLVELVFGLFLVCLYRFEVLLNGLSVADTALQVFGGNRDILFSAILVGESDAVLFGRFFIHTLFFFLLLVFSLIDLEDRIIPDALSVPGTVFFLGVLIFFPFTGLPASEWIQLNRPIDVLRQADSPIVRDYFENFSDLNLSENLSKKNLSDKEQSQNNSELFREKTVLLPKILNPSISADSFDVNVWTLSDLTPELTSNLTSGDFRKNNSSLSVLRASVPLQFTSPIPAPAFLFTEYGLLGLLFAECVWFFWCFALMDRRWYGQISLYKIFGLFLRRVRRPGITRNAFFLSFFGGLFLFGLWLDMFSPTFGKPSDSIPLHSFSGYLTLQNWLSLLSALFGLLIGMSVIWFVRLTGHRILARESMGFGDVILMGLIGAFLGWQSVLLVFFIAPFFGILFGIYQFFAKSESAIPFGPFLCLAAVFVLFFWTSCWFFLEPFLSLGWFIPILLAVCFALFVLLLFIWQKIKLFLFKQS